jgi:hypothetical protein
MLSLYLVVDMFSPITDCIFRSSDSIYRTHPRTLRPSGELSNLATLRADSHKVGRIPNRALQGT